MERYVFFISFFLILLGMAARSQTASTPIDDYLEYAETIVVARCVESGPVNKIAQASVELEVLHILKGEPGLTTISTSFAGGLTPGSIYLIRIPDRKQATETEKFGSDGYNVIKIESYLDIEFLKSLPPRIIVLRIVNSRLEQLETTIRNAEYELGEIIKLKVGN